MMQTYFYFLRHNLFFYKPNSIYIYEEREREYVFGFSDDLRNSSSEGGEERIGVDSIKINVGRDIKTRHFSRST